MQAIILAGGFGTRLRSCVPDRPKPMALVAGRPFLEYLLDRLADVRCSRVVLATGHMADRVEAHFGASYRGMSVLYSRETTPLGTGGATRRAMRCLDDGAALVMNGDTWFGLDLPSFVAWSTAQGGPPCIALRDVPDVSRYAAVELSEDHITGFGLSGRQGSGLINAGIYWLAGRHFAGHDLPESFSIENDFFKPHAGQLDLRGLAVQAEFIDIGVPADYDRAQVAIPLWLSAT